MSDTISDVIYRLGHPLTLAEKVLYSHLDNPKTAVSTFFQKDFSKLLLEY